VLAGAVVALVARSRRVPFGAGWRAVWRGKGGLAWRAMLLTLAGVLLLVGPVTALATEYHVFGTDKVGQDVLFLTLKSIRTALVIGTPDDAGHAAPGGGSGHRSGLPGRLGG
jgi:peptide/nickel transport system permease protein